MAEITTASWAPESPWHSIQPEEQGSRGGDASAGVVVQPVDDLSLVSVIASAGQADALRARCAERFGLEPSAKPQVIHGRDLSFVWSGPGHWLAVSRGPALLERLRDALEGSAALSDQGSSRAVLRLSGPNVRDILAKGVMLDLHPAAFLDGDVAITIVGHVGTQIWRDGDDFLLAVSRSYAGSLWTWLSGSAAEFGWAVREAD